MKKISELVKKRISDKTFTAKTERFRNLNINLFFNYLYNKQHKWRYNIHQ